MRSRSDCTSFCRRADELKSSQPYSRRALCTQLCRRRRSQEEPAEEPAEPDGAEGCSYNASTQSRTRAVQGLKVQFNGKRGEANVSWNEIPDEDDSWDAYCILWTSADSNAPIKAANRKISKDKHHFLIPQDTDHWSYPHNLYLNVIRQPLSSEQQYDLKEFNPMGSPTVYNPATPSKDPPKLFGSIIGGCVGGLFLLGVLVLAIMYRKFHPRTGNAGRHRNADIGVSFNNQLEEREFFFASYYPESAKHVVFVAGIVNWFRERGYSMIMDKMASNDICSNGPMRWAERQIKKARKVVVFMSPGYARLCDDDEELAQQATDDVKRVWYEMCLLRNIYCNTHSAAKIVCVLLDKTLDSLQMPPWAAVTYRWPDDQDHIMKRLNDCVDINPSRISARLQDCAQT